MIKCKIILSFAERKKITLTNYIDQFEKLSYFYFQYNDGQCISTLSTFEKFDYPPNNK